MGTAGSPRKTMTSEGQSQKEAEKQWISAHKCFRSIPSQEIKMYKIFILIKIRRQVKLYMY